MHRNGDEFKAGRPARMADELMYALDPGVILDRIEISFDGAPTYYGRPLFISASAK